ncbi:MAG: hypothetical protein MI806_14970, partial [Minwuiales bacterium]|nr:hypothetical protein [Minwuiales bacterium]
RVGIVWVLNDGSITLLQYTEGIGMCRPGSGRGKIACPPPTRYTLNSNTVGGKDLIPCTGTS